MTASLFYEVHGSGPGLVLIHGTGSSGPGSWGTILEALARDYTVVLPNLPGSEHSPLPAGPLDLDTIADQIAAAAADAGLESFALAGISLGAPVAVRVAGRHPDKTTRLALIAGYAAARPSLRLKFDVWAEMSGHNDPSLAKFLAVSTFSDRFLDTLDESRIDQMGGRQPSGILAQIDFARRIDVRADLANLRMPTLVVAHSDDQFVDPAHSRELAGGIPAAELVETEGGHGAIIEHPDRVTDALLKFLAG